MQPWSRDWSSDWSRDWPAAAPEHTPDSPWAASSHTASAGWPRWSPELSEAPWTEDLGTEHTAALLSSLRAVLTAPLISSPKLINTLSLVEFTWGQHPKIIPKFFSPTRIQFHS